MICSNTEIALSISLRAMSLSNGALDAILKQLLIRFVKEVKIWRH